MKKLLLGMFIGAAISAGIFYYLKMNEENQEKEEIKALIESIRLQQAKGAQTNETINNPNSALMQSALTVVVGITDEFYYYRNNDCNKIAKADLVTISNLLKEEKARTRPTELMILIKVAERSTYRNAIDLLDAITMAEIPAGHFAEVDLSEREKLCITQYKKN